MVRAQVLAFLLLPAALLGQSPPPPVQKVELAELNTMKAERDKVMTQPLDWGKAIPVLDKQWKRLAELLATDALSSGADFYVAALIADDPTGFFERRQIQHELALTALLLDEPSALFLVPRTWDWLHISMARPQRVGTMPDYDLVKKTRRPAKVDPESMAKIRDIFMNPGAARKRAKDVKDNQELQDIRTADQKARESFDMNWKAEDFEKMAEGDRKRRARVLEMISAGDAKTSKDFEAAALVFQHSEGFKGFQLAHELSIISVMLGTKDAAWLISRSYDRLLLSCGYRQRYATNFNSLGLQPTSEGINDRMRQIAKTESLDKAKKRGEDMRKQVMAGGG